MGPSFDKYNKYFLENLYAGSRKLNNCDISKFFGGSLCFSPKDVKNNIEMYKEIQKKLMFSLKNWQRENDDNEINDERKNFIFGLFDGRFVGFVRIFVGFAMPKVSFATSILRRLHHPTSHFFRFQSNKGCHPYRLK